MRIRHRDAVVLGTVATLLASIMAAVTFAADPAAASTGTPVVERRIIGYSVKHRPIVAYHLGDRRYKRASLILGEMHGNEHAGVRVANSIIHGTHSIERLNLWVIPTMNPDGDARHTRGNAHHVDLNRNWPDHWAHLSGQFYSGRRPLSEPETRAMRAFLLKVRPHYIVSLHQPLHGVDTTDGGHLDPAFRNRLVRNLGLRPKAFRCWSFCHGSMTGWYTTHRYGIGETVEFGAHPSAGYLTGRARAGIVHALGGHFGRLSAHNPRASLGLFRRAGHVYLSSWAYDIDARGARLAYRIVRDGHVQKRGRAGQSSPLLNRHHSLSKGHALRITLAETPGRHTICVVYTNIGAGTGNTTRCGKVDVAAA